MNSVLYSDSNGYPNSIRILLSLKVWLIQKVRSTFYFLMRNSICKHSLELACTWHVKSNDLHLKLRNVRSPEIEAFCLDMAICIYITGGIKVPRGKHNTLLNRWKKLPKHDKNNSKISDLSRNIGQRRKRQKERCAPVK